MNYNDKDWQLANRIKLDFNYMMSEFAGKEHGITEEDIEELANEISDAHNEVKSKRESGDYAFMELPYQQSVVSLIKDYVSKVKGKFDNFVVLGIGGSALGNIMLQNSLNPLYYNYLPKEKRGDCPRIFVIDNSDPEMILQLKDIIDPSKTLFNIITKSGGTAESIAAFIVLREWLKSAVGEASHKDHIVVTTDPEKGDLRQMAIKYNYHSFEVPKKVGGRFSVLTPVGLLSASIAGIDIEELLAGAAYMDERCRTADVWENPAYFNAVLHYIFDTQKGKHIAVMMPYSNALKDVADWFRQLWAESLGKKYSTDGEVVHTGQTPVKALGATDQHSQIQLYIEGPFDKMITFLVTEKFRNDETIPYVEEGLSNVDYLGNHTISELINAEYKATALALAEHQRPNCSIILPQINPFTIGQLIYMLELQTVFAGALYNIDPTDQPGVEAGKIATYAMIGRFGYQDKKKEIEEKLNKKSNKYIID